MSAFYAKVDKAFYDLVAAQNGGKLPKSLLTKGGKPRKLNPKRPADAAYIKLYKQVMDDVRGTNGYPGVVAGEPSAPCGAPPGGPPKLKQEEKTPIPCKHENLVVECGHGERGYVLTITPSNRYVVNREYGVVAGPESKADTIECSTQLHAVCPDHAGRVFDLTGDDLADTIKSKSDSKLVFKARSYPIQFLDSPFLYLWPMNPRLNRYSIRVQTDEGLPEYAFVVAYPDINWSVKLSLNFGQKYDDQSNVAVKGYDHNEPKSGYSASREKGSKSGWSIAVTRTYDGVSQDVSLEFERRISTILSGLFTAKRCADLIAPRLKSLGGVSLAFEFPTFDLSGTWGWKEVKGTPLCGFACDLSVGFDPLFGVKGEIDLLAAILSGVFPGSGPVINHIRQTIANDPKAKLDFYLKLTLHGKIAGKFDFHKSSASRNWTNNGQASGEIGMDVTGGGEFEANVFYVKAGGGVKIGAKAKLQSTTTVPLGRDQPSLLTKAEFTGLVLYYAMWVGVNKTVKMGKPKETSVKAGSFEKQATDASSFKPGYKVEKRDDEWVTLIPAHHWPQVEYLLFHNTGG